MISWFGDLDCVTQALFAGGFTWLITALGAALVLFTTRVSQRTLDTLEGFAAGIMIAASYWSLLAPAIEIAAVGPLPKWIPVATGFLLGGLFLWVCDRLLPHLHGGRPVEQAEGIKTSWQRTYLLVLAITLHNVPEGLAVGVGFGAAAQHMPEASLTAAVSLAVGIGLQNLPEGLAISLPLRREGASRGKSFFWGQASALVEPVAAVLGAAAVTAGQALLPYLMSFAAGAMIFVVIEELIPASHREENHDLATLAAMAGFTLMMVFDLAFG